MAENRIICKKMQFFSLKLLTFILKLSILSSHTEDTHYYSIHKQPFLLLFGLLSFYKNEYS